MAALSGSVVGSVLAGVPVLLQAYAEQRQKINENDWSEDISDKYFGYVMDQGQFFPAVLRKRVKGEGKWDESNQFTWIYGKPEEFYLKRDGTGKIRGQFLHEKTKEFRVSDESWDSYADEDSREKYDYMRQWYVIPEEDTPRPEHNYLP